MKKLNKHRIHTGHGVRIQRPIVLSFPVGALIVADDETMLGEVQKLAYRAGMLLAHRCGLVLERVE